MPPEQLTNELILNTFETKFANLKETVAWIKDKPQGWRKRVAEFDAILQRVNDIVSGKVEPHDGYHDHVVELKEDFEITQLPTLSKLASLQTNETIQKDSLFFSCQLIERTLDEIAEEMKPGGDWEWVLQIDNRHQVLTGLLGEGYGSLLAKSSGNPNLKRAFILAFEEVLWTEGQNTSLLNDYVIWMLQERNDFAPKVAKEVGGDRRYQRVFGDSILFGDDPSILNETPESLDRILAWSHACPVPGKVVKKYGIEYAVKRYAQCNFWSGYIIEAAGKLNPPLQQLLVSSVNRLTGEPEGEYETDAVPDSHKGKMSPSSTPWGYALPRIFIEQLGEGQDTTANQKRLIHGLNILEEAIKASTTPANLLANLAEKLIRADAEPMAVVRHIFADGLRKEGCGSLIKEVAQAIKDKAPQVWDCYTKLTEKQRKEAGIIALSWLNG